MDIQVLLSRDWWSKEASVKAHANNKKKNKYQKAPKNLLKEGVALMWVDAAILTKFQNFEFLLSSWKSKVVVRPVWGHMMQSKLNDGGSSQFHVNLVSFNVFQKVKGQLREMWETVQTSHILCSIVDISGKLILIWRIRPLELGPDFFHPFVYSM